MGYHCRMIGLPRVAGGGAGARVAVWLLLMATAGLPGSPLAQPVSLPRPDGAAAQSPVVPDPAALTAGWWDYLDSAGPELDARIANVLRRAEESAAGLPPEQAGEAGQSLERLRISLEALPGLLALQPAVPPELPPPPAAYTTREFLQLDRQIRDLQLELEERRTALSIFVRALKQGQRQHDDAFAAYLGRREPGPEKTLLGLQIMAGRAENAVTEAEQTVRSAEQQAIEERLAGLMERKRLARDHLVPDPERTPEQIADLIDRNLQRLEQQRAVILRLKAERNSVARRADASPSALDLADQKIIAAMVEETYLATRVALYETETDWLQVATNGLDATAIGAIQDRLATRRTEMNAVEANVRDWFTDMERALGASLRVAVDQLPPAEARLRSQRLELIQETITRLVSLRSLIGDVRLAADVTVELIREAAGWRGWLWTRVLNPAVATLSAVHEALDTSLFRIGDAPVTSYSLLRIGLFLLIAVILSRLLRYLLARFGARAHGASSAGLYTVGRLLHYVIMAAALLIGLTAVGLDFSQLALLAGALSIGIGFGLQSIVNNFVSGVMILFERSLKIGDVVELDSGVRGVVKEINVRSTVINTNDHVDVVVPNSEFIAGKVTNYTLREPFHRIHVPFGVAYGTDKELVRRVVTEAARRVPFTLTAVDREPDVWLVKFGESSLDFELVVWINPAAVTRPGAVMATYLWEIDTVLRGNGIEIPFPQRDVHLKPDPPRLPGLPANG